MSSFPMPRLPQGLDDNVRAILVQAEGAPSLEDTLTLAAEALAAQLLDAMKASKISKADQSINALRKSGLHLLLLDSLMKGKLTKPSVDQHLDRILTAIRTRSIPVVDLKNGIMAFDEAAQRLASVAGKTGPFQYPLTGNHPRDLLITFARSLHR